MANDVNSMPSGITSPPTIERRRMERLRHSDTTNGIASIEMDQLSAPSSSVNGGGGEVKAVEDLYTVRAYHKLMSKT